MILDKLTNLKRYKNIHPNLDKAINWIENNSIDSIDPGKTLLDGDNLFVVNTELEGYNLENGLYEIHHKYADLHIVIDPKETIYYAQVDELNSVYKEYDTSIEMKLFHMTTRRNSFKLNKDEFAFFFPYEAHGPKIVETNRPVKKLIFKIKMN
ncbi:YhcH/YjgK/YiaL family protein [Mesomycoplasma neurolyticum]|uniref:Possible beta-galactosidase, beta subunit n=1 Tax=Mesomycoplasma neurolyticum TaxID=2120 RepID=A0A449A4F9_9BACT|nr:YhcH/YjgK/YiaL family protein [Mesomycoplasma neurolyticum]VEU59135.1 Possible beta-galactosidase, beta subunit [Mesomycoplasma neurolyticum]